MPLMPKNTQPTTDPEWDALSDEALAGMTGQRANSERIARQASKDLRDKMNRLNGTAYRLAVNVYDLTRMNQDVVGMLLGDKIDTTNPVVISRSEPDEVAAVFSCDLVTAAACCDVLRSEDRKLGMRPVRIYRQYQGRQWTKVGGNAVFTEVVGERVMLRVDLFPAEVELVPTKGIAPERIDL